MAMINLTDAELAQVLWAVGQMTDGNARDIDEMRQSGCTNPVKLISAETKLRAAQKR